MLPATVPIRVRLPDGNLISSSHVTNLSIPKVPTDATRAHILPSLQHQSLLSVGQLCDHGCIVTFSKRHAEVRNENNTIVLTGTRRPPGLWEAHLPTSSTNLSTCPTANSVVNTSTKTDLITFLHAAAFSPVPSTFIKAIKHGHFATWPGLTPDAVRKHLPKSLATTMGHLDQSRKNQRSTKPNPTTTADDFFAPVPPIEDGRRTHFAYAGLIDYDTSHGKVFTDLTGRFPVQSSRGNKYFRNDPRLRNHIQYLDESRITTTPPTHGQRNFHRSQINSARQGHNLPTGTTRPTQTQRSRTRNPYLQEPSCRRTQQH